MLTVGVGASAGGLAPLEAFLQALPENCGMAAVIVLHRQFEHDTPLSSILSDYSALPVHEAADGEEIKANTVYVIPADTYMSVEQGRLSLSAPRQPGQVSHTIDYFFRSLAEDAGENCAGVLLSGIGDDGIVGLRSIKAAGGLTLAQPPETADYEDMPMHAMSFGLADVIISVEKMPAILRQYAKDPRTTKEEARGLDVFAGENLEEVSAILEKHQDFNLVQYKPSTVKRRIARRMSLTGIERYTEYVSKLRESEDERAALARDLLINVTDFFRDIEGFEVLETKALPALLDQLEPKETLRVWIVGCATGEEAYSIAMLLLEALERRGRTNPISIFATDIDEEAINTARQGVYPGSIRRTVPRKYLDKYFTILDSHYRIKSHVRDLISFALHNIASDPPFSHVHFISCRNVLIYLTKEVQAKIFSAFHFALEDDCFLFLGSSESLVSSSNLYETISKKWRLFRKLPGREHRSHFYKHYSLNLQASRFSRDRERLRSSRPASSLSRNDLLRHALLQRFTPPSVIVDQDGNILYSHGDWKRYMDMPSGEPRFDIKHLLLPAMRSRMRSALYKVRKSKQAVTFHCSVTSDREGKIEEQVRITLQPLREQDFPGGAIGIAFHQEPVLLSPDDSQSKDDAGQLTTNLERELLETREELQNTIEELEINTEELKTAHEEALSTNEELQSANEELEASSEELRSLNEELSTVNAQLKKKIDEVQRVNDDVENFFTSTNLPTIFLNPELEIQRYTPAAETLLGIGRADLGRRIYAAEPDLLAANLVEECRTVLKDFHSVRNELETAEGHCFIRQVTPYRTRNRHIEGVVLVFYDVTELKVMTRRTQIREQQHSVVARLGLMALEGASDQVIMDQAVADVAANLDADYCQVLKYQPVDHNFNMVAGCGWPDGIVGNTTVPDSKSSQAGFTLFSREPVIVDNLAREKRFSIPKLLTDHAIVSGMSCVINHQGSQPYGVLGVYTRQKRTFTREDADFLISVAYLLSSTIHNHETQGRLHESEEQFRTMANAIPQLAWMADANGNVHWFNQRWYDYTGLKSPEIKTWNWRRLLHPDYFGSVTKGFLKSFSTGKPWEATIPIRGKQGQYRWFLSRSRPIYDNQGNILRWFGTNTDITEQLEYERALQESENRLNMARQAAKIGIHDLDIVSNESTWDERLREIWGLEKDQRVSREFFLETVHSEDRSRIAAALEQAFRSQGEDYFAQFRIIRCSDQAIRWIEATGKVVYKGGKAVRMVGTAIDITEQMEADKDRELLSTIVENSSDAIISKTLDSTITSWNAGAERLFGYRAEEVIGKPITIIMPLNLLHEENDIIVRLKNGERTEGLETVRIDKQGKHLLVSVTISPIRDSTGKIVGASKIIRDNTETRQLGMRLQEQTAALQLQNNQLKQIRSRLEHADQRKNEFLAILGHELRNPLATISGGVDMIKLQPERATELAEGMGQSINLISSLLDDMLDLTRISLGKINLSKKVFDLRSVLVTASQNVLPQMKEKGQKFHLELSSDMLLVDADPVRMEQIVVNLLSNARKYTQENGNISLDAVMENDEAVIRVRDNGIGIPKARLQEIFEPFVGMSSKAHTPESLGIGLALVKQLTEQHGGRVEAESSGAGKGSVFTIYLPKAPAGVKPEVLDVAESREILIARLPDELSIMIVDDNQNAASGLEALLRHYGFKTETATSGRETLEKAKHFKADAFILDIGMPEMNGYELAQRLRKGGFKDALIVALSGYGHEEARIQSANAGIDHHLNKPLDYDKLLKIFVAEFVGPEKH